MTIAEIKKMPVKNRIILMEEIWQTLNNKEVESPLWHKKVIEERMFNFKNKQTKFISINDLKSI